MENSGQTSTILIVEDIEWIRVGMRKAVERQGFRVAEARNDAEAFAFAELQSIDLILTEEEVPTFKDVMARLRASAPPRLRASAPPRLRASAPPRPLTLSMSLL